MNELTSEMIRAYVEATGEPNWSMPPRHLDGLAAVAALAGRPAAAPHRCADCGRSARQLTAVPDGDATVWLGPTCLRRRRDAAAVRQALPIGGER
ncbi:hypothetical protein [Actinoplanes siamensis]|uniref:Uncharacterized protein n=1 Tax=Actinoplanes siamensis TaxID=1223317 RepID=A0A919ND88_9ACTN|nr:hypothetical protein [Actinoplanes siamensis]GIF08687.1 hypothetical protein Asi03nite_62250 [Actinoplanes siamensis]